MAKCRGCGAEIIWIGRMPCDPDPVAYWEKPKARGKIVTQDGMVVSCEFAGDIKEVSGIGYISHFSTCPCAGQFRRRG